VNGGALAPLHDRRFRLLFAGRSVSMLGSSMAPVALAFAVLGISDSAAVLGTVLAARSIPMAAFLLLGGVVADRFSRSLVLQVSHLLSALTQGAVAVLLLTGSAEVWSLVALEALNGTVAAFTFPALNSVVPAVVDRSQLQRANALLAFSRNGLYVLGPTTATALVVTVGAGWALAADALTWLVAAGCMGLLRVPAADRTGSTSVLHDLRIGWGEFTARTWVWLTVVAAGLMNVIIAGVWVTLGPVIAKDSIGIGPWGWVLSAQSLGLLAMTAVLTRQSLRRPLRAGMLGLLLTALPMLVLGIDPEVVPLVLLAFAAGAGMEVFGIGWTTAVQEHVPEEVLSRVFSYDALGSFVAIPVGQLLAGPLAQWLGAREVAVGGAALFALVAAGTLLSPSVRELESAGAGEPAPT
jgi:MFS family permease